jgi:hypothetical protein
MTAAMLVVLGLGSLSSFAIAQQYPDRSGYGDRSRRGGWRSSAVVPAGTAIDVRLDSQISTEDAQRGDSWTGVVNQSVYSGNLVVIPAGSQVTGVVTTAAQGTHTSSAQLGLAIRRVDVNGRTRVMNAQTETIVAGSNRAKKIGAIAGGAAAGALLGHAVAKDHHGTLIGGLLGGLTGYGATRHAFRTMQLKPGTVVTFTTNEDVALRR